MRKLLGKGSEGSVYLLEDGVSAVKEISLENLDPLERARRIQAAKKESLIHRLLYGYGEYELTEKTLSIKMRYIEGITLEEFFKNNRLSLKEWFEVMLSILQALISFLEKTGCFHLDLARRNIIINAKREIFFIDFTSCIDQESLLYSDIKEFKKCEAKMADQISGLLCETFFCNHHFPEPYQDQINSLTKRWQENKKDIDSLSTIKNKLEKIDQSVFIENINQFIQKEIQYLSSLFGFSAYYKKNSYQFLQSKLNNQQIDHVEILSLLALISAHSRHHTLTRIFSIFIKNLEPNSWRNFKKLEFYDEGLCEEFTRLTQLKDLQNMKSRFFEVEYTYASLKNRRTPKIH